MPDTLEEAAKAGITAIIQPGGSIRDEDSIKVAILMGLLWCSLAYVISNTNRGCLKVRLR